MTAEAGEPAVAQADTGWLADYLTHEPSEEEQRTGMLAAQIVPEGSFDQIRQVGPALLAMQELARTADPGSLQHLLVQEYAEGLLTNLERPEAA